MADVLIVYFSRSGTTERAARQLAEELGADLDRIRPTAAYAGAGGFRKGVWHSLFRAAPAVDCDKDPAGYSLVVVGSPVWAGGLSAPMRSYLKRFGGRIGALAAFWVSGSGQRYQAVPAEIERLTGRPPLATASLAEREVGTSPGAAKLDALAQALHLPPRKAA